MIDGVRIVPLRQIVDERGKIMHMLKATDPHFISFGEIYFSTAWPGTVKAWHIHQTMTVNNAVISGRAKLVLYDMREGSPTKGELQEIYLGEDNYVLVQIPPGHRQRLQGLRRQAGDPGQRGHRAPRPGRDAPAAARYQRDPVRLGAPRWLAGRPSDGRP